MVTPFSYTIMKRLEHLFALCFSLYRFRCFRPEEFVSEFPSPTHPSSSGSYHLDLSVSADLIGSNATAGLAVSVIGTHKPLLNDKVVIDWFGIFYIRF